MKKFNSLLPVLVAAVFFMSSCASVFEGRNYSHLDYVKAKKDQKSSSTQNQVSVPNDRNEDIQHMVSKAERGISFDGQESVPQTRENKKEADNSAASSPDIRQNHSPTTESDPIGAVIKKLMPFISDKQQKKIESATDQLFVGLDHDLRLALIFGIAGLIVMLIAVLIYTPGFGEVVYTIGAILLIIGLVFLIKYLVENG